MLNKKVLGIAIASVVAFFSLVTWLDNLVYSEEEPGRRTVVTEQATTDEETLICPSCKEKSLSPGKRGLLLPKTMVCPECKNEVSGDAVHHCDKCGKDVLVCPACRKASAELDATTMESKCPKCKLVRSRPIKGKAYHPVEWKMKCPDCKQKPEEMIIQHCDTCGEDFLACSICKAQQEKAKGGLESGSIESKCPKCETERVRPIKGKAYHPIDWKMKCPDCKKEPKEWLIQQCETCDENYLVCPICKNESKKTQKQAK
ncbi:MAG: hypothetical protein DWB56_03860 [Candidatus Jettenia sp.]|uniref:Putative heme protein n=1 Tax=Candidatus Jettenia caeni TaxID=247490 RepID=I3INC2_9BACT|nr:hypothetical protein [Candidatus Jettenia sp. AMX1]MBC6928097.1 hypothetical protein [Candidatus Jettenia sp.]WKZ14896.1 MAG: hypothetical protein QY317_13435 [Candidatus Jettenia caeni]KAA0251196.1 MAG: hypothetical protein EDM77_02535 [Candidatus Jettenia sp. AMX1]MCE7879262.1 hypothetical protein [Candidatus Jettenia sp. AMX1]MCQ3927512.1 hypothetical protein [Candidatus Jettenia sp.]